MQRTSEPFSGRRHRLRWLTSALLALAFCPLQVASAQDSTHGAVLTGGVFIYTAQRGDTLALIGARFGVGGPALEALNRLRHDQALLPGQQLTIDNRHIAIVDRRVPLTINIGQRLLFLVDAGRVEVSPIAVGVRTWPTPVGAFTVVAKEENPTWDVPLSIQREMRALGRPVIVRMPPSPQNPLGAHWIGLSFAGIGIHGTIAPSSIYRYASHGCLRMHPDDVARLYQRVIIGTPGVITYRPVIVASINGRVLLEAHLDGYRRDPDPLQGIKEVADRDGFAPGIDWAAVADVLRQRRGLAVDVTKDE